MIFNIQIQIVIKFGTVNKRLQIFQPEISTEQTLIY